MSRVCQLCSAWYTGGHGGVLMLLWQTRALHHAWSGSRPSGYYFNHGLAELDEDLFAGGIVFGTAGIWRHSRVPACVIIIVPI